MRYGASCLARQRRRCDITPFAPGATADTTSTTTSAVTNGALATGGDTTTATPCVTIVAIYPTARIVLVVYATVRLKPASTSVISSAAISASLSTSVSACAALAVALSLSPLSPPPPLSLLLLRRVLRLRLSELSLEREESVQIVTKVIAFVLV